MFGKIKSNQNKEVGIGGLGELVSKLESMAPSIADAFVKKDKQRTGKFSRKDLKETLYMLNVPTTNAQIERVFQSLSKDRESKFIAWWVMIFLILRAFFS